MVITLGMAASMRGSMLRVAIVSLLATGVVAMSTEASAQGRRARLSEDLVERLRSGDTTETSVIVTGTQSQVNALAERHGLRIRKRLHSGAVVDIPAGWLSAVAYDPGVDHLSGNHRMRVHMGVSVMSTGADQVHDGLNDLPRVTGKNVGDRKSVV